MANEYSGPARENNEVKFYFPENQYHPTTRSRIAYWHQMIEYTRSFGRYTRYTMKLTIFVLIALAGFMLDKPAVAEAPVLDQLTSRANIGRILENVAASRIPNSIANAGSRSQSDETSLDANQSPSSETNQSPSSETNHSPSSETSAAPTVEEESAATATEEEIVTDSTSDESETPANPAAASDSSDEASVYEGSTGCCIWPARGRVTSRVTRWHTAIDIAAPYWSPVVAADGGRVIAAGWDRTGYGYRMIIDHGSGLTTLYAHMARYYYDYGDYVNKGMVIGRVGSTGNSSGNHLHFEVRVHNYRQNPWNWLP